MVVSVTIKLVGELIHMTVPSAPPPCCKESPIDTIGFGANAAVMVTI